ncbi:hypothetical protein [Lunatimonas salinarum]|uniref:hypothetical protein n=1 Tax=Lunatimonas salinarum TaxID=1774590 RepID=UPI001ADF53B6|nr:hypothetical protein [Lunatimonas salinarum]
MKERLYDEQSYRPKLGGKGGFWSPGLPSLAIITPPLLRQSPSLRVPQERINLNSRVQAAIWD